MKKSTALKNRFLISLVAMSLILLFLDRFGFLSTLKSTFELITSPLQKSFTEFNIQILSFQDTLSNLTIYKERVGELSLELEKMRGTNLSIEELLRENEELRSQLGLKLSKNEKLVESNIINFSDYYSPDFIVIDVGLNEQIAIGDIVVFGKYAVGEVKEVKEKTSDVELISSKGINLAVENLSGTAKGVLKRDIKNRLLMTLILPEEQLTVDEQIITNGINSPYPYGLLVGKVNRIDKSANNFNKEAEIEKYLDFVKLHKVFVIKKL